MRFANIFAHFLIIPPTKFKRQGYSTHFEAAGHIGDKEGVRNDGKFFLNSKVWCVYFDLLKMIQLLFIEMNKLNNNSLG